MNRIAIACVSFFVACSTTQPPKSRNLRRKTTVASQAAHLPLPTSRLLRKLRGSHAEQRRVLLRSALPRLTADQLQLFMQHLYATGQHIQLVDDLLHFQHEVSRDERQILAKQWVEIVYESRLVYIK